MSPSLSPAVEAFDLDALRAETPGCGERVHLNNAGAALMPEPVLRAVTEHLQLEAQIGGYEAAAEREAAIAAAYEAVATLLGASPRNVAMAENATAAYAQALSAIPFERGDAVVVTRNDYVSNQIMLLSLARRFGLEVLRPPDDPAGGVDVGALEELARTRRPRLVAVTHVPTSSGLVQPVEEIGRICRELDVPYPVDACQSFGQMPLDVDEIGCDFLSATSRKFLRGPRGAGFLYVSDRILERGWEPLFLDLRGAEWTAADGYRAQASARRFENWEFAYALVLGTGEAARYAARLGLERIAERAAALAAETRRRLAELPGARLLDRGRRLSAIVPVTFEGVDPKRLLHELRRRRINASLTYRDSALLDFGDKGASWALRVSPHYYNRDDEIEILTAALREILSA